MNPSAANYKITRRGGGSGPSAGLKRSEGTTATFNPCFSSHVKFPWINFSHVVKISKISVRGELVQL